MDLNELRKDELNLLFLTVHSRYLRYTAGKSYLEYTNDPEYLDIPEELWKVMDEMKRRRQAIIR